MSTRLPPPRLATRIAGRVATLGFAYVSASGAHATEVLEKVARYIEVTRPDLDILEEYIDTMEMGVD